MKGEESARIPSLDGRGKEPLRPVAVQRANTGHMREMVRLKEMRVKGWNDLVALRRRSLIVNAADATLLVRRSKGESDFYFVAAEDPETAVSRIVELVKTRIPGRFGLDPVRDIQVLCPMNRGGAGARSLNIELQAALNPTGERKVERFGWTFAPGDKVMGDADRERLRQGGLQRRYWPGYGRGPRGG